MIVAALFSNHRPLVAIAVALLLALAFLAVNTRVIRMVFSSPDGERMERGQLGTLVPIISIALSVATILFIPEIEALLRGVFGV